MSPTSHPTQAVIWVLAWVFWVVAGAFAFDLLPLVGKPGAVRAALDAASPQERVYVGIWVLGSVALLSMALRAIHQRRAQATVQGQASSPSAHPRRSPWR